MRLPQIPTISCPGSFELALYRIMCYRPIFYTANKEKDARIRPTSTLRPKNVIAVPYTRDEVWTLQKKKK